MNKNIKIIFFDVGSVLLTRKESFDLLAAEYLGIDFPVLRHRVGILSLKILI